MMKNLQVQMIVLRILREVFEAYTEQKQSTRKWDDSKFFQNHKTVQKNNSAN